MNTIEKTNPFDSLGDRAKKYENTFRHYLPIRMPVICRLDGKSFHSYVKGCAKPFDDKLISAMNEVALALVREISGSQLAYIQSDEISILIHTYKRFNTEAYFDNNIQKIVSVAASIAGGVMTEQSINVFGEIKRAAFDARVFVVPEAEVCNILKWRQDDASRNSIQMLARSLYTHKECEDKNISILQDMCFNKGHNWNDLPTHQKRGRCAVKAEQGWVIDNNIPIFSQDRNYVNKLLKVEEE